MAWTSGSSLKSVFTSRDILSDTAQSEAPWASQSMKSSTLISPIRRSWSVTGVPEIRLSLRMARRSFIRLWGAP